MGGNLSDILDLDFILVYHLKLSVSEVNDLPLVEYRGIIKRLAVQKKREADAMESARSGNNAIKN